ncbi:type IV pilus biogenesis/stability protein PilW [Tamilnaduibacter salinus]|nr:type IV pilus biogenesis/stability protein PilW [Tamilnaduibacter salinus]
MLGGCVTTTTSPFAEDANAEKAVSDYVRLGTAYISQGNYERAREHLRRALEIDPESSEALATLGLVHQSDGEHALAEQSYRQALDNDPSYTRGRVYFGTFLYNQGRFDEAVSQFKRASTDTDYNDRASVFQSLGKSYEALEQNADATSAYRRAVEISRGNPQYLLSLSGALVRMEQYSQASRYYSRLRRMMARNKNLRHSPESLLTGIRIARHFGNKDREASLALLLEKEYPQSEELKAYRQLATKP